MTEKVHPTQGEASSQLTSGAIKWAAQSDWIVPSGDEYLAAFAGLSGAPLNGFQETHSASSLDVTIDTGEAFVGGRWCGVDATTTVTLASSTANQTVYLGWESSTANSVVIGLDSAFSSSDDGRRAAIWEFDTDGSGVTGSTQVHNNEPIHPHAANADALGGSSESKFAKLAQNETVSGGWTFEDVIHFDSAVDVNARINANTLAYSNQNNDGMRFGVTDQGRVWFAPVIDDDSKFSSELTYHPDSDEWEVETQLKSSAGTLVGSRERQYRIEKDGSDANGVINFKTS